MRIQSKKLRLIVFLAAIFMAVAATGFAFEKQGDEKDHAEKSAKHEQMKKEMRSLEDKHTVERRAFQDKHEEEMKAMMEKHRKEKEDLRKKYQENK